MSNKYMESNKSTTEKNPNKWKRLISYYKPYKKVFFADMFFAFLGAVTTLILPLIIRYVTNTLVYEPRDIMMKGVAICAGIMVVLVIVQCYSNYYIANYGHVMGAKIEYDMRNEIFGHFQKLSFSFYDNQKVGQLMSRITNDLFDITELLHHGPEEIVISTIKLIGSFVVLMLINPKLALAAFAIIPIMIVYAYTLNRKMKRAFKNNRAKVADINAGIEDNLSGIRVVKSFANEDIEKQKFIAGNDRFLASKKDSYLYMGRYHSGLGAFVTMITVIVMVTGAILLNDGSIKTTDLLTFLLYISNFTEPVKTLINFAEQFQNASELIILVPSGTITFVTGSPSR